MPRVLVSLDGVRVQEVAITQPRTTIGRRPYNDIVIDALAVSGEHAVLELMGSAVLLEDLGSTNGTRVNGTRTKLVQLKHGDTVDIGQHKLQFFYDESDPGHGDGSAHPSRPIELNVPPTRPAGLSVAGGPKPAQAVARVRVMAGPRAGQDVPLVKIVTTFGKPGEGVVAITARRQGHVLNPIEAPFPIVNGAEATEPVALADRDLIELSGVQMQFLLS